MVYAAQRIRDRAIRAARLMDDHLATEAARIGVPDADALTSYEQGRRDAPTGRQPRATTEQRRAWPGLPLDPRTRSGLAALAARPDNPDGRNELIDDHRYVQTAGTVVAGTGYHPGSGRLEVVTPDGAVLAYRDVPPALAEQLRTGTDPDHLYRDRLQGNPAFQYRDAVQAAAAGVRRRCADCGQFTGATHNCLGRRGGIRAGALGPVTPLFPTPLTNLVLPRIGPSGTDLPVRIAPLEQIIGGLERVRGEGVEFPFQATYPGGEHLTGSLSGALDTDDHVSINTAHLACTCDGYAPGQGCPHTQAAATGVRDALAQQLIDSRAATAQATAAAITGGSATTRPATEAALPAAPNLSTFSYAQDPARFASDVRAALARPTHEQVPWIDATDTEPGLYGYGATRDFGVELEFDVHHNAPRLRRPRPRPADQPALPVRLQKRRSARRRPGRPGPVREQLHHPRPAIRLPLRGAPRVPAEPARRVDVRTRRQRQRRGSGLTDPVRHPRNLAAAAPGLRHHHPARRHRERAAPGPTSPSAPPNKPGGPSGSPGSCG